MADKLRLRTELTSGLKQQSLNLQDQQIDSLLEYLELMNHWNRSINLTAISDPLEQVRRHLLDSFSVYSYITDSPVLDVGTGAGLPGIPLAIAQPQIQWHLLDSSTKRISFLRRLITKLNLKNVQLINSKVEEYKTDQSYPLIICRAFASLKEITHNAQHLMATNGSFLAMKGQYPEQEIADMSDAFTVTECYPLTVPGLSEDRHLLQIKQRAQEQSGQ